METSPNYLPCDGCGLPASPKHIAERVQRLKLSTRFRPVHIGVLFVALAPPVRPEDDFYSPAESKEFFDPFLEALEIPASADKSTLGPHSYTIGTARRTEFQRRGYYLAYLSECPDRMDEEPAASTIARLCPMLIRRIRFNYKPKQIAILGGELGPLRDILDKAGIPATSVSVLEIPSVGDAAAAAQFRATIMNISSASV